MLNFCKSNNFEFHFYLQFLSEGNIQVLLETLFTRNLLNFAQVCLSFLQNVFAPTTFHAVSVVELFVSQLLLHSNWLMLGCTWWSLDTLWMAGSKFIRSCLERTSQETSAYRLGCLQGGMAVYLAVRVSILYLT